MSALLKGDTLITENAWAETQRGELNGYDAVVYAFGGQAVDALSQSSPRRGDMLRRWRCLCTPHTPARDYGGPHLRAENLTV